MDVERNDWENPEVTGRNRELAHATLLPYADAEEAFVGQRDSSPYYQSLNGPWWFHWATSPDRAIAGFHRPEYDASGWPTIMVPANWQMQGYGIPQ